MKYILKIYRGSPGHQLWQEFELELRPFENVISALMEIQKNPVNTKGEQVPPISFEAGCLEEVCGSCSMLINSRPRQACTSLIEQLIQDNGPVITVAPMTKFPLVRDLIVDREKMFDSLKRVHAWVELDKAIDRGPGPKIPQAKQDVMYTLSTCMTCGCCLEACPQVNDHSPFIGAAAISQARLFNIHPVGKEDSEKRFTTLMGEGGIADCGNAQNCVKVCPKKIPLTESIDVIGRQTSLHALKRVFGAPENKDTF